MVMTRVEDREGVTDEELMRRVNDMEDVEAFGFLDDRHATRAYRVARSVCGDTHRSEEAVQEGFLSIWRGRARFCPGNGSSFQAWSMTIVRHAAIDALRYETADKRPRVSAQELDNPDSGAASPEDQVVAQSEAEALRTSLARLPHPQAEVISLAFFVNSAT